MKQYKLVCLDIDGTLLNAQHELPQENIDAVKRVKEEYQVPVALVSARAPQGIVAIHEALGLTDAIAASTGAFIFHGEKVIQSIVMEIETVRGLCALAEECCLQANIYNGFEWYAQRNGEFLEIERTMIGIEPVMKNMDTALDDWQARGMGVERFVCFGSDKQAELYRERVAEAGLADGLVQYGSGGFVEFFQQSVCKSKALNILCKYYGVEPADVLAAGDSNMDMDMIEAAGMGIAMGNAQDAVKQAAGYVAKTNDENGLALALDHFFPPKNG